MPLTDAGKNACLTGGLGNAITHISAHTTIPNSSGNSEVTGGSYARVSVSWGSAASGVRSNSGILTIEIPAATTAAYLGYWSASSNGTFYGYSPVNDSLLGFGLVGSNGVSVDSLTSNGHGLTNGTRVAFTAVGGESLPAGISAATLYYVVGTGTDTFQISTSLGGSAVNITGQGEFFWQSCTPEVFAGAGQLVLAVGDLDLMHVL